MFSGQCRSARFVPPRSHRPALDNFRGRPAGAGGGYRGAGTLENKEWARRGQRENRYVSVLRGSAVLRFPSLSTSFSHFHRSST